MFKKSSALGLFLRTQSELPRRRRAKWTPGWRGRKIRCEIPYRRDESRVQWSGCRRLSGSRTSQTPRVFPRSVCETDVVDGVLPEWCHGKNTRRDNPPNRRWPAISSASRWRAFGTDLLGGMAASWTHEYRPHFSNPTRTRGALTWPDPERKATRSRGNCNSNVRRAFSKRAMNTATVKLTAVFPTKWR